MAAATADEVVLCIGVHKRSVPLTKIFPSSGRGRVRREPPRPSATPPNQGGEPEDSHLGLILYNDQPGMVAALAIDKDLKVVSAFFQPAGRRKLG